jgi:hypothetical protein
MSFAHLVWLLTAVAAPSEGPSKRQCLDAYTEGQAAQHDGHLVRAREQLLICSRAPCPGALQNDCMRWLQEVNQAMPSVILAAKGADGSDLSQVTVYLDDALLTEQLDGRATELDPGRHTLRFQRAGAPPIEQAIVVREAEKRRMVEVRFVDGAAPASAPQAASPPPSSEAPVVKQDGASGTRTPIYVSSGIGAVSLAAWGAFSIWGITARAHLESCKPGCDVSAVTAVNREFWVADISLAVAAVALVATLILIFANR